MYDYIKSFVDDGDFISHFLSGNEYQQIQSINNESELIEVEGFYKNLELRSHKPFRKVEITGSLHKLHKHSNATDFSFREVCDAVTTLTNQLGINASECKLVNLEFGVNIELSYSPSEIIEQFICHKYRPPMRPYDTRPNYCFIEVAQGDYFIKLYDKGLQYMHKTQDIGNLFRFEVKGRNSRYLNKLNIATLEDLYHADNMRTLGRKLNQYFNQIIFDDSFVDENKLTERQQAIYSTWRNPRKWSELKKHTSTSTRRNTNMFQQIVKTYGHRDIRESVGYLMQQKVSKLIEAA